MKHLSNSELNLLKLIFDPKISLSTRKILIQQSKNKIINQICEVVLNILNGNIKVDSSTKEKLKPYAKICRKLLDKKTSISDKKKF